MADDIGSKTRIYTDIQSLKQLNYAKDSTAAKKEVAQQFESLMMQMVLRSMRDATKSFSSGLFSNNSMELYQDMFDKQISLMMSNSNLGFAKMIEKNIDQLTQNQITQSHAQQQVAVQNTISNTNVMTQNQDPRLVLLEKPEDKKKTTVNSIDVKDDNFDTPEKFVKTLWGIAKKAASYIGTTPEILIAQAALETNWGKNILSHHQSGSSHNLFNIKAGKSWDKKTATVNTIEHKNGVLVKEKSEFRSYDSYKESFMDYINVLKTNDRYNEALNKASNPEQFIRALHHAGYATDQGYAEKILRIFSSQTFKNLIAKVKNI